MDRSWVYVPQLPPLQGRGSVETLSPGRLHSSCPWAVLLPILLPHILTRGPYWRSCSSFPSQAELGSKRETSGNSAVVVVVAGYMISIIFCLESRVSKIGSYELKTRLLFWSSVWFQQQALQWSQCLKNALDPRLLALIYLSLCEKKIYLYKDKGRWLFKHSMPRTRYIIYTFNFLLS